MSSLYKIKKNIILYQYRVKIDLNNMRFCILVLASIVTLTGYGQFAPVPMNQTIRTPYGNQTITTYQHMPMHYYGYRQASVKHNFTIVLRRDSTVTANTKIDISEKQHTLRVKTPEGKKILVPANAKEIYRFTYEGKKLTGIPADTCWLFKVATGAINSYSHLAEEGYQYVIAIQDGDDAPIVPLTLKNLEAILGETMEPKVKKLMDKNNLAGAVERYNNLNP
jgi:hypothetical protein